MRTTFCLDQSTSVYSYSQGDLQRNLELAPLICILIGGVIEAYKAGYLRLEVE